MFGGAAMKSFFKDESGATAIEYGLIAAAMGVALVRRGTISILQ
jgi:Flp pilus assembly pilin Flp